MKMNDLPGKLFEYIPKEWYGLILCVEHHRFIPCRKCLYDHVASMPYLAINFDQYHKLKADLENGRGH